MSMNETPRSNRLHIALFGRRNAGKSSVINAIVKQDIAVVSPVLGTTTDPVYKAMELLPIGPVVLIDTAGLDDEGELGELRKQKTYEVLNKTDMALLIIDSTVGVTAFDRDIADKLRSKSIPAIAVLNKIDLLPHGSEESLKQLAVAAKEELNLLPIPVSAAVGQQGISELKKAITQAVPDEEDKFRIVGDLLSPGDLVVLVVPIDKAAPKGRLILPQQQVIRDILESDAISVVTKEHELRQTLESLGRKPRMVITDSQVFLKVAADTPKDIPLTSFSILFARHKGDLEQLVRGARAIDGLKDGDKVLIAESCTHHQQPDDIGKVKIPRWILQATGKQIQFDFANGMKFPDNVRDYSLIVHCGGCMLNRRQMLWRIEQAEEAGVPIVNYGVAIAHVQGILERAISPFPLARLAWEESGVL
ncbi:[FeFe] hydrogenase H-cluster maturation GTPase HydF [Gorillibacterium massiliense]|uniref:[FeFe] hydrogenase H-cluster maturation GTPase HydF n=1 Tax=Gorillibacterium massiliense TaxID=1280390 RepID=UPI0004B9F355|nr:[FeFe] hydrogenase H-cluster maturation GTPase HydF [Gorillibacterium massiliense]